MCSAIILTKGQTYECYCQGFKLINEAVLESICGQRYLNLFFTVQSSAETNAIDSLAKNNSLICTYMSYKQFERFSQYAKLCQ